MKLNITPLPYITNTQSLLKSLRALGSLAALESTNTEHENGRWGIITAAPIDTFEIKETTNNAAICNSINLMMARIPAINSELPFTGGVIGAVSYDLPSSELKPADRKAPTDKHPSLIANLYTWAFLIDHQKQATQLVYWSPTSRISEQTLLEIYSSATKTQINSKDNTFSVSKEFQHKWNKSIYKENFDRIINYINKGDCYQINLTQQFFTKYKGDELVAYARLKQIAKVPYACFLDHDEFSIASASPEQFIHCTKRAITTKPIKGTQPRNEDPIIDLANLAKLTSSLKDKAENLMIVDLLRNDISKNAIDVKVDKLFEVESFSTVHHLVSTVSAKLRKDSNQLRLFLESFPGGSITGAPKIRAMQIISELEAEPRGFYCGSVFAYSCNDIFNSSILIRTFTFSAQEVTCAAGGGITIDSNWQDEYQESLDKISKLMKCLSD